MIAVVSKPDCDEFAKSVCRILGEVSGDESTAGRLGIPVAESPETVVVLGGDGTLLLAERLFPHIPKLSIGCGHLSFLSTISAQQIKQGMDKFMRGEFAVDERTKLKCERGEALNEIAVLSKHTGRMVSLRVAIDGKEAEHFRGDGVVVATPTGSTAYAMSAGGPILDPGSNAVAIVPVSPFRLASRPIVVSADSRIRITAKSDCFVSMDGFSEGELKEGEHIDIEKGSPTKLVVIGENNHYKKLRML